MVAEQEAHVGAQARTGAPPVRGVAPPRQQAHPPDSGTPCRRHSGHRHSRSPEFRLRPQSLLWSHHQREECGQSVGTAANLHPTRSSSFVLVRTQSSSLGMQAANGSIKETPGQPVPTIEQERERSKRNEPCRRRSRTRPKRRLKTRPPRPDWVGDLLGRLGVDQAACRGRCSAASGGSRSRYRAGHRCRGGAV